RSGADLAVHGGPAARRSHAPARAAVLWPLRGGIAEAGWRARAHGAAVEIRLQKLQVHRAHPLHGKAAAHGLEHGRALRVRLLLEREPLRGPSALEPGDGAAPGRILEAQDADVQRLR